MKLTMRRCRGCLKRVKNPIFIDIGVGETPIHNNKKCRRAVPLGYISASDRDWIAAALEAGDK